MSEKQKKILEAMNKLVPQLSELDQERLLAFGEGLAFIVGREGRNGWRPRTARERPTIHGRRWTRWDDGTSQKSRGTERLRPNGTKPWGAMECGRVWLFRLSRLSLR